MTKKKAPAYKGQIGPMFAELGKLCGIPEPEVTLSVKKEHTVTVEKSNKWIVKTTANLHGPSNWNVMGGNVVCTCDSLAEAKIVAEAIAQRLERL